MNWKSQVESFKKDLTVEAPRISTSALRIGFFGLVGGGKSVTAGICALGITPDGLIGWIDGEGKRSGWAIDQVAQLAVEKYGGTKEQSSARFKVIHVDPPFNPLKVVAAVEALEELGVKTVIADCLTQAWDSDGGYLDLKSEEVDRMLEANQRTSEAKVASAAAAHIKPWTHQKLVNKLTNSKTNVILVFQAKQKYNAKNFKPDDFVSPIQESGLTRTALAVGRVQANDRGEGGYCNFALPMDQGTKFTHQSILAALPKNGDRFTFSHAEALRKLCENGSHTPHAPQSAAAPRAGGTTVKPSTGPSTKKEATAATLKWMLDELVKQFPVDVVMAYAIDKALILPAEETLEDWPLAKVPVSWADLTILVSDIQKWKGE